MFKALNKHTLSYFAKIFAITLLVLLLIKAGLAVISVAQLRRTSLGLQTQIEQSLAAQNLDYRTAWDDIQRTNRKLGREFFRLRLAIWPLDRLADRVALYPWGKSWAGAVYQLDIGESLSAAVGEIDPIVDAALIGLEENTSFQSQLVDRLKKGYAQAIEDGAGAIDHQAQIEASLEKLERLAIENSWLNAQTDLLQTLLPLAQVGLLSIEAAPEIGGFDHEHHMLILLQNEDELRPTGGFITSSIYLTIKDGKIKSLETLASNDSTIDHFAERYYTPPPAPFSQYMELSLWLFRDANWSPDFPTSAAKAASLYSYGREVEIDTVIGVNQTTVEMLLAAIGPVQINDQESLSADNAQAFFQDLWTEYRQESVGQRKLFIADLVPALIESMGELGDGDSQKLISLSQTLAGLAQSGDLLIYSADADIQRWAEAAGLDGSIPTGTQDYLYPVVTNMGYDKSDFVMERSLEYHVSLRKLSEPFGMLTLTAENKGLATPGICPPNEDRLGMTYLQRATSCNVNYLRLYLPNRSELLRATRFEVPESHQIIKEQGAGEMRTLVDERNHNVYGGVWITPPQITSSGRFVYALHPAEIFRLTSVDSLSYQLMIQKQPGVDAQPVQITIDLPDRLPLRSTSLQPSGRSAGSLVYELTLDRDLEIELLFDVAPNQLEQIGVLLSDKPYIASSNQSPRFEPTRFPLEQRESGDLGSRE